MRLADQAQFDPLDVLTHCRGLRELGGVLVEGVRVDGVSWARPCGDTRPEGDRRAARLATRRTHPGPRPHLARLRAIRSYARPSAAARERSTSMYLSADSPTRSLRTVPDTTARCPGRRRQRPRWAGPWAALGRWPMTCRMARQFPRRRTHLSGRRRTTRPRDRPVVGLLPARGRRVCLATGYDKWGMTNAVAAAHVLAGDLLGQPPEYAEGSAPSASPPSTS